MPAVPLASRALTASVTLAPVANHNSETSSCVGPIGSSFWFGVNGGGGFGPKIFDGVLGFSGAPPAGGGGRKLFGAVTSTSAGVVAIPLPSSWKRLGSIG